MPKSLATGEATSKASNTAPVQPPSFADYANEYTTNALGVKWEDVDSHFASMPMDATGKRPKASDYKREVADSYEKDVLPQYYSAHQLPQVQAYVRAELAPTMDKFAAEAPPPDKQEAKIKSLVDLQQTATAQNVKSAAAYDLFRAQKFAGEKLISEKGLRDMSLDTASAWIDSEVAKRQRASEQVMQAVQAGEMPAEDAQKHLDTLSMEVHRLTGAKNVLHDSNDLATAAVYAGGGIGKLFSGVGEFVVRSVNGASSFVTTKDKYNLGKAFADGFGADTAITKFFSGISDDITAYEDNFDSGDNSKAALDAVTETFDKGSVRDALGAVYNHPSSILRVLTTAVPESVSQMVVGGGTGKLIGTGVAKVAGRFAPIARAESAAMAQAGKYAGVVGGLSTAAGVQDANAVKKYVTEQLNAIPDDKFLSMPDVQAEADMWMKLPPVKLSEYITAKKESMARQAHANTAMTATAMLTLSSMLGAKYGAESWVLGNAKSLGGKSATSAVGITASVGGVHEAAESVAETATQHYFTVSALGKDSSTDTPFSNYGSAAFQGFIAGAATDGVGGYLGYRAHKAKTEAEAKAKATDSSTNPTAPPTEPQAQPTTDPSASAMPSEIDTRLSEIAAGKYDTGRAYVYTDDELSNPATARAINDAYAAFSGKDVPYSYEHITSSDNSAYSGKLSDRLLTTMQTLHNIASNPDAANDDLQVLRARHLMLNIQALLKAKDAKAASEETISMVLGGTRNKKVLPLAFDTSTTDPEEAINKAKIVLSEAENTADSNVLAKHIQTLDSLIDVIKNSPDVKTATRQAEVRSSNQEAKAGLPASPNTNGIVDSITSTLEDNAITRGHNEVLARYEALKRNAPEAIGDHSKTALAIAAGLPISEQFTSLAATTNPERSLGIDVGFDSKGEIQIAMSSQDLASHQYRVALRPVSEIVSNVLALSPSASLVEQYNAALRHINNYTGNVVTAGGLDTKALEPAIQYAVARELLSKLRPDYITHVKSGALRSPTATEKAKTAVNMVYRTMVENSARTIDGGTEGKAFDYVVGNTLVVPEQTSAPLSLLNRLRNDWMHTDSILRDTGADRLADVFSDLKTSMLGGAVVAPLDTVIAQARQVSATMYSNLKRLQQNSAHDAVTSDEMKAIQRIASTIDTSTFKLASGLSYPAVRRTAQPTTAEIIDNAMQRLHDTRQRLRESFMDEADRFLMLDDAELRTITEDPSFLSWLQDVSDPNKSETLNTVRLQRVVEELGLADEPALMEAVKKTHDDFIAANPNVKFQGKRRVRSLQELLDSGTAVSPRLQLRALLSGQQTNPLSAASAAEIGRLIYNPPVDAAETATSTTPKTAPSPIPDADLMQSLKRVHDDFVAANPNVKLSGENRVRSLSDLTNGSGNTRGSARSQLLALLASKQGTQPTEATPTVAASPQQVTSEEVTPPNATAQTAPVPMSDADLMQAMKRVHDDFVAANPNVKLSGENRVRSLNDLANGGVSTRGSARAQLLAMLASKQGTSPAVVTPLTEYSKQRAQIAEMLFPSNPTVPSQLPAVVDSLKRSASEDSITVSDVQKVAAALATGALDNVPAVPRDVVETQAQQLQTAIETVKPPQPTKAKPRVTTAKKYKEVVKKLNEAKSGRTALDASLRMPVDAPVDTAALETKKAVEGKQPSETPAMAKAIIEAPLSSADTNVPKSKRTKEAKPDAIKKSRRRGALDPSQGTGTDGTNSGESLKFTLDVARVKALDRLFGLSASNSGVAYGTELQTLFKTLVASKAQEHKVHVDTPEGKVAAIEIGALFKSIELRGLWTTLLESKYLTPEAKEMLAVTAKINDLMISSDKYATNKKSGAFPTEPVVVQIVGGTNGTFVTTEGSHTTFTLDPAKPNPRVVPPSVFASFTKTTARGSYSLDSHTVYLRTDTNAPGVILSPYLAVNTLAHELIHSSSARALDLGERIYRALTGQFSTSKRVIVDHSYVNYSNTSTYGMTAEGGKVVPAADATFTDFKLFRPNDVSSLSDAQSALLDYFLVNRSAQNAVLESLSAIYHDTTAIREAMAKSKNFYALTNTKELVAEVGSMRPVQTMPILDHLRVNLDNVGTEVAGVPLASETLSSLRTKSLIGVAAKVLPSISDVVRSSAVALAKAMEQNSHLTDLLADFDECAIFKGLGDYALAADEGLHASAFNEYAESNLEIPRDIDYTKLDDFNEDC